MQQNRSYSICRQTLLCPNILEQQNGNLTPELAQVIETIAEHAKPLTKLCKKAL